MAGSAAAADVAFFFQFGRGLRGAEVELPAVVGVAVAGEFPEEPEESAHRAGGGPADKFTATGREIGVGEEAQRRIELAVAEEAESGGGLNGLDDLSVGAPGGDVSAGVGVEGAVEAIGERVPAGDGKVEESFVGEDAADFAEDCFGFADVFETVGGDDEVHRAGGEGDVVGVGLDEVRGAGLGDTGVGGDEEAGVARDAKRAGPAAEVEYAVVGLDVVVERAQAFQVSLKAYVVLDLTELLAAGRSGHQGGLGLAAEALTLRRANAGDLETVLRHRVAMFRDMGMANPEGALEVTRAFFAKALAEERYHGWFLTDGERVVAGGGIVLLEYQPQPAQPQALRPFVVNVWTEAKYRRRGLARRLMEEMIEWARTEGYPALNLHASDAGRALYEELGFVATNEMRLKL